MGKVVSYISTFPAERMGCAELPLSQAAPGIAACLQCSFVGLFNNLLDDIWAMKTLISVKLLCYLQAKRLQGHASAAFCLSLLFNLISSCTWLSSIRPVF